MSEGYKTFRLMFFLHYGHSFFLTMHSAIHWWQNEWPHIAIRQLMI